MKKYLPALILAFAAFPAVADTTPQGQSETLAAQVTVTHDAIEQVITKIKNMPVDTSFSNADYLAKSKVFNDAVTQAMNDYEANVTNDILKPASRLVDQMKAVQNSGVYSPAQKSSLLAIQLAQAGPVFDNLSQKFTDAVYKLYLVALPKVSVNYRSCESYVDHFTVKDSGAVTNHKTSSSQCMPAIDVNYRVSVGDLGDDLNGTLTLLGSEHTSDDNSTFSDIVSSNELDQDCTDNVPANWSNANLDSSAMASTLGASLQAVYGKCEAVAGQVNQIYFYNTSLNFDDLRDEIFNREVKQGCYSSSCIGLTSTEMTAFLNLVDTTLNQPIKFDVVGADASQSKTLTIQTSVSASTGVQYLTNAMTDIGTLPFDIDADGYRKAALGDLKKASLGASVCPAAVGVILRDLCGSDAGCLNGSEKSALIDQINDAGVGSASKRIACLSAT